MHPLTLIIIVVGPPILAYLGWLWAGYRKRDQEPWKLVRLGHYGYWIILGVIYAATLATALVEHKI